MKTLIDGCKLIGTAEVVAANEKRTLVEPVITLAEGLKIDDTVMESPLLIMGNTGVGKTCLLNEFQQAVYKHARATAPGTNIIAFSPKDDILRFAHSGDIIIDCSSKDPRSCWSICEEMLVSGDVESTIRTIGETLFAEDEEKTSQPFFPKGARDIFQETCLFFYEHTQKTGIKFSNADIIEFFRSTPIRGNGEILGWLDLAELYPNRFGMMKSYLGGEGNEQGMGLLSELRLKFSGIFHGSFASSDGCFSCKKAISEGGAKIFIKYDYSKDHASLPLVGVIIDLLLTEAINSKNLTYFFLDEFSQLPKSETLFDSLSLGRANSKGGGTRIIACIQSAKLMSRHYRENDEAQTLLSLFPNVISMRIMDYASREVVADRYGKAHYLLTQSAGGGKTIANDYFENTIIDGQFSKLQTGQAIMSIPALSESPFFYDGFVKGE